MGMLRPLPLRALVSHLCCRRGLTTLAILLVCLPVAAAVAVVADEALEASRLAQLVAKGAPTMPEWWTPAVSAKMARIRRGSDSLLRGWQAPDFTLPDAAGKPVTLSSFRGRRPVVLVFGSFGCNLFCDSLAPLRRLHSEFKGRAAFLFIYISEALHGSTPLPKAARPIPPPDGDHAHRQRLLWYEEETSSGLRWLLDGADERVEELYAAWPRRLLIIGTDGRVVFDAGHGLGQGWDLNEVERHLRAVTPRGDPH